MNATSVLIVSQRHRSDGFGRQPGYVSFTEAEDVLAECADADVLHVKAHPRHVGVRARRLIGRTARRLPAVDGSLPLPAGPRPGAGLDRPRRDRYDVAVFIGFTLWDLPLLETIGNIDKLAERVIVWFPEAWSSEFDDPRLRHEPFGLADAIFVGMKETAEKLSRIAPCPVHHLPPAVDVACFAARPHEQRRPIDVLGIGRRDPRLHQGLLEWTRKNDRLYVYDTISGTQVPDATAHRENLGDTYRHAKIAITHYAKYDVPEVIGDQRETPGRLWEGLASGALMVGFPPDESLQRALIGEPVVTELPTDPAAAVELIGELIRDDHGERRRRQVQLALRNHDWVHRWAEIFRLSGAVSPRGFATRSDQLELMAAGLNVS